MKLSTQVDILVRLQSYIAINEAKLNVFNVFRLTMICHIKREIPLSYETKNKREMKASRHM